MTFRILNNRRKIAIVSISILSVLLVCIWAIKIRDTNSKAYNVREEIYDSNDYVALNGNYFFEAIEKTDGYSIKLNSVEIEDYDAFYNSYNREAPSYNGVSPKHIVMINVTVKNDSNTDGCLPFKGFGVYNGALYIPIDFEALNMIDPKINGSSVLQLKENSEVTLSFPFSAMPLDEAVNSNKLNDVLENEDLYLCVCEFPVRKLILIRK